MDTRIALAGAGVALVVLAAFAWWLRDKLDLIAEHARDAVRHALAGVLMLGTLAGTVWTFSAGRLALGGNWETGVSVGGVAAALELGVIYTGWYIGQLDQRIRSARKADEKAQLSDLRTELMRWFYGVAAISAIANLIYRTQALGNFLLALFISVAPIVLVILFCIKLRPLPTDHVEIGRQAAQRGLVMLARQAQANMLRALRKIGNGHVLSDAERAQLVMALSFQRAYLSGEQAQALDSVTASQAMTAGAAYQLEAPTGAAQHAGAAPGGQWLSSADVMRLYGVSERGAQVWIAQTPGRRKRPHSTAWEAPAANVYAAHGVPAITDANGAGAPAPRRRRRTQAQPDAQETLSAEAATPAAAFIPPVPAAGVQLAVFEPSQAAGMTQGESV